MVDAGEDRQEVCFECPHSAFGGVAAVGMRRDELIGYFPRCVDCVFIFGASFVVQDLKINLVVAVVYASHDVLVRFDAMDVTARLKRFDEDCVGGLMVCNHEVLIARLGADGEASRVVCVEFVDVSRVDMHDVVCR